LLGVPNDAILDDISDRGNSFELSTKLRVQQRIFRVANDINVALFDLLCVNTAANEMKQTSVDKNRAALR
jgi:hypothetical protein